MSPGHIIDEFLGKGECEEQGGGGEIEGEKEGEGGLTTHSGPSILTHSVFM